MVATSIPGATGGGTVRIDTSGARLKRRVLGIGNAPISSPRLRTLAAVLDGLPMVGTAVASDDTGLP